MKKRLAVLLMMALLCAGNAQAVCFQPENATEGKLQALACLMDCAFSAEYGEANTKLLRWQEPIRIYVCGAPTKEDLCQLDAFIMELSFRVPLLPKVERVENAEAANITMYFVPRDDMGKYVSNYVTGNDGFVTYFYENSIITRAEIAVACDKTVQAERNGILREELVNGLGLGNDHYRYEDSIIYEPYNIIQTLSEVDWLMLNMVYSPYTKPGMTANEAYLALYREIMK